MVGLFGQGIGPSEGLYLHGTVSNRNRTHDSNVREVQDPTRFRLHGHWGRHYFYMKSVFGVTGRQEHAPFTGTRSQFQNRLLHYLLSIATQQPFVLCSPHAGVSASGSWYTASLWDMKRGRCGSFD